MSTLKELKSHHFTIMHRLVNGEKARAVCADLDFDEGRLSIIRQSPLWKEKEEDMRREIFSEDNSRIQALRGNAIDALSETIESTDEGIKLRSAKEILDRTGIVTGLEIKTDMKPIVNLYVPVGWNNREGLEEGDIIEGEVTGG